MEDRGEPIDLLCLIDTGDHARANSRFDDLKDASRALLDGLRPNDRASIVAFSDRIRVLSAPTTDHRTLGSELGSLRPGGTSSLRDALFAGLVLRQLHPGRALLLVFTQGWASFGYLRGPDVLDAAHHTDAPLADGPVSSAVPASPVTRAAACWVATCSVESSHDQSRTGRAGRSPQARGRCPRRTGGRTPGQPRRPWRCRCRYCVGEGDRTSGCRSRVGDRPARALGRGQTARRTRPRPPVTRTLRVHADASEELAEAVEWYEARRRGLGHELFEAVVDSIESLPTTAEMGTPLSADGRTRRVLLPRFPYQIVCRLAPSEIVVVAVAHAKRRPGFWRRRR